MELKKSERIAIGEEKYFAEMKMNRKRKNRARKEEENDDGIKEK